MLFKSPNEKVDSELQNRIEKKSDLITSIFSIDEKKISVIELLKNGFRIIEKDWPSVEKAYFLLSYDFQVEKSDNFKKTDFKIEADRPIRKISSLNCQIYYERDLDHSGSGLFYHEDKVFLDAVIGILAMKIESIIERNELDTRQKQLDKAYNLAHIGTWEYDMLQDHLTWSDITKEIHGFEKDYRPTVESTILLFKEGYDRDTFAETAKQAIENYVPFDVELRIISGKGDERWIRATGEPEFEDGVCTKFYGISQNVTDRRKAEENLELNEKRFKALVQEATDVVVILDSDTTYKYVSPSTEKTLGLPKGELLGKQAKDYIHPDDWERTFKRFKSLKPKESFELDPYRFKNSKGEWRWISTKVTNLIYEPAVKGYVANSKDITEKKLQNELILTSLSEKETLLAEIHHRVKNNLAVITGLLQLHIAEEDNEESLRRLYDSVSRIYTISNIHEQLYKTTSFSKIKFSDNVQKLTSNILNTFKSDTNIDVEFNCDEVHLNLKQALPCSLIVNEVVTNILKHAFKKRDNGEIIITALQKNESDLLIKISDNGVGLPDDFKIENSTSLGMKLIEVLSTQLEATCTYDSTEKGTTFQM